MLSMFLWVMSLFYLVFLQNQPAAAICKCIASVIFFARCTECFVKMKIVCDIDWAVAVFS